MRRLTGRDTLVIRRRRRVVGLKVLRRLSSSGPGFLTLERLQVKNLYRDGRSSRPYRTEVLHRRGVDAVAILPYFFLAPERRLMVICKVGFRPGLYRRGALRPPVRDRRAYTRVIEAVAGSLETGDRGERAVTARARRELLEETGFTPRPGEGRALGSGFFPSHGQSTEKIHLRAFEIDPKSPVRASGDGSINEEDSGTVAIEASHILRMCRRGLIEDPKLEIGVSRLIKALLEKRKRTPRT